jgi:hypothetical protein
MKHRLQNMHFVAAGGAKSCNPALFLAEKTVYGEILHAKFDFPRWWRFFAIMSHAKDAEDAEQRGIARQSATETAQPQISRLN